MDALHTTNTQIKIAVDRLSKRSYVSINSHNQMDEEKQEETQQDESVEDSESVESPSEEKVVG